MQTVQGPADPVEATAANAGSSTNAKKDDKDAAIKKKNKRQKKKLKDKKLKEKEKETKEEAKEKREKRMRHKKATKTKRLLRTASGEQGANRDQHRYKGTNKNNIGPSRARNRKILQPVQPQAVPTAQAEGQDQRQNQNQNQDENKKTKKRKCNRRQKRIYRRILREWEKMKNRRNDLHHKTAAYLTQRFATIFLPKFRTQQMASRKKKLHSSTRWQMLTLAHYSFREMLIAKAQVTGCKAEIVGEGYTTKTCSSCGKMKVVGSSEIYRCNNEECGLIIGRDMNAARNIFLKSVCQT